jgi:hypothetical protein
LKRGGGRGEQKHSRGCELVQDILYVCMELSLQNPLLVMYANLEIKCKKILLSIIKANVNQVNEIKVDFF